MARTSAGWGACTWCARWTPASSACTPTTSTSTTCTRTTRDSARGDAAHDGRLHPRGQGAPLGALQLPRLAHRRGDAHRRPAQHAAPGRAAALLQRDEPHARGRGAAGLRVLRPRRGAVQPARARRAHRQVQARREAARGIARRPQRPAHHADGVPQGVDGARGEDGRAREASRHHARASSPRRGCSPTTSSPRCSPARARSSSGRSTSARSSTSGSPRTTRWSTRLVAPGHPSTPGYSDPMYPFYGRTRAGNPVRGK